MRIRSPFLKTHTLRWQMMAWHSVWLCLVMSAFGGSLFWLHRRATWQEIDSELVAAVEVLRNRLHETKIGVDEVQVWETPATFRPRQLNHASEQPYFSVWDSSQRLIAESPPFSPRNSTFPRFNSSNERRRDSMVSFAFRDGNREAIAAFDDHQRPLESVVEAARIVVVGRDVRPDQEDLRNVLLTILFTGFLVVIVGLLGDWWLAKRLTSPIVRIAETATELSGSDLSQRIDTAGMTAELAQLGCALNQALARIEAAFDQQRQFTADASHELRTPLASLQLHQQLALSKDRTAQQYRETIETCQRSVAQMSQLVHSLLNLARLDSAQSTPLQPLRIDRLVEQVLNDLRDVAADREVTLGRQLLPAEVLGDAIQLRQLITNLVMNAIEHSPPQSTVEVKVELNDQQWSLVVSDRGCGIAAEHLPNLFRRFYRVESARDRKSGGCGLGLSICEKVAERHRAKITVESVLGEGSRFRVRFDHVARLTSDST